jgi:hypothetical protein
VVTTAGFFAGAHDPTLCIHVSPRGRTLLLLYANDMIITGDDPKYIETPSHFGSDGRYSWQPPRIID